MFSKDRKAQWKKYKADFVFILTLLLASVFSVLSFVPGLPFAVTYHIPFFTLIVAMVELYSVSKKHIVWNRGVTQLKNFNINVSNLVNTIGEREPIDSIDIYCYNSNSYYLALKNALSDQHLKVKILRLLVFKPEGSSERFDVLETNINRWNDLRGNRIIDLKIKFFQNRPTFYFSVFNGKYLHWGLFTNPYTNIVGTNSSYVHYGNDRVSDDMKNEFQNLFNDVWNKHSYSEPDKSDDK